MKSVVYDAAVLIGAERDDRGIWARHRVRMARDAVFWVPAAVVAQVSRSSRQARLRHFLEGCIVVGLDETMAHVAGRLLGETRTADVVDATVVAVALSRDADSIVTGDREDIERLVEAAGASIAVVEP